MLNSVLGAEMLHILGNHKQLVNYIEYKKTRGCINTDISIRSYGAALFFRTIRKRQKNKKKYYEPIYSNYIEFLLDPYIANPALNSVSTWLTHRTRSMFVVDIDNPAKDGFGVCFNCLSIDDVYDEFERQFGLRPNCHRISYKGNGNLKLYIIMDKDKYYEKEVNRWYIDITQWFNSFKYVCPNGKTFTGDQCFRGWRCQKPDISTFSGELYSHSLIFSLFKARNEKSKGSEAPSLIIPHNDEQMSPAFVDKETRAKKEITKGFSGRLMLANKHFVTRWRKYKYWLYDAIAVEIKQWSERQQFVEGKLVLAECKHLVNCLRCDDQKGKIRHNYIDEERAKSRATRIVRSMCRYEEAKKLRDSGYSYTEIAKKIDISKRYVIRLINYRA